MFSTELGKILEQLLLRMILGAATGKKIEEMTGSDPCDFRFSLFLVQLFVKS